MISIAVINNKTVKTKGRRRSRLESHPAKYPKGEESAIVEAMIRAFRRARFLGGNVKLVEAHLYADSPAQQLKRQKIHRAAQTQIVRWREDQHQGSNTVQRQTNPQRNTKFRGAYAMLNPHHEDQHDSSV